MVVRLSKQPFLFLLLLSTIFFYHQNLLLANNINISNVELADQDTSADTIKVEFDLSRGNAWRDSVNRDAAWIFLKYSTDSGTTWNHAILKNSGTNPSGFSGGTKNSGAFSSLNFIVPSDKRGSFVEPAHEGSGTLNFVNVQVVWDYGASGLSDDAVLASTTIVKVFGIEMVYVPQEGFQVGDGSNGSLGEMEFGGNNTSSPGPISGEEAINFNNNAATFYYNTGSNSGEDAAGNVFSVGGAFPKGFMAFYMMKYEITQGQYVDFLNTLTLAQQKNRVATTLADTVTNIYVLTNTSSITNRNTVRCPASGNGTTAPVAFSTTTADRACNYLSWMDLAAYLDWAALRPMTELEFEKAARGPIYPVDGEHAWGTTSKTAAATISGTEDGTETITTSSANAAYNNTTFSGGSAGTGPLRAGVFSTSSTTTRPTSGASYYGIMELTGNVWERPATIGNASGRSFAGTHGDGILTTTSTYEGNATNLDWPGISSTASQGVTGATGGGQRGGGWATTTLTQLEVSNRKLAASTDTTRGTDYGGRGVRTAS